jgi:Domain of unknown function (DUF4190)/GYF domain 2
MNWYYADETQKQNIVPEEALAGLVAEGVIQPTTLVWNEQLPNWVPCREIRPDLFGGDPLPPRLTSSQVKQVLTVSSATVPGAAPVTAALDPVCLISMILGIMSIVCFQPLGVIAVIMAHMGRRKFKQVPGAETNAGFAMAGLITGYIGVAILAVLVVFYGFAIFMAYQEGSFDS